MTQTPLAAARLFVRDLVESVAFYQANFDWPLVAGGSQHGYCVFDVGHGVTLVIEPVVADADEEEQSYVGRFTGLSFRVDDIASHYNRLRANGVMFTGAPEKQFWGGTVATLKDPAGNQLQLVEYPR